ncbi:ribosome recycling factor [Blastocystis sp. subtype 4]|uniref:ribosome recycling factor n=1 Tax=Blastocystis sp. subtype 4 TaxID=944170 RepID=UPI0007118822|nr:ribosome recycling factor [Blastocystis sp. subtype 4]KNB46308.1 ribosome recycling factor [Blastocystis sp. subtype 4]|eukprot:XP_014529736.1 ribosome recycling factor [Blastocystis sp. subtype 4]
MIELNDFPNDQKISTYLANSYTKIQASRFDPRMIEQMKVDIGTKSAPLNSIAQITAKTQISFLITPFDPSNAPFLLKALKSSDLNLNPQMDKNAVHIQVPKTTKETRQKLIKQVGTECEQQKGKLRNVRKKYMDKIRLIEKSKTVSKDDIEKMKKKIDAISDSVTKDMTEMMKKKEESLEI